MATEVRVAGAKPWGSNTNLLTAVPKADSQHLTGGGASSSSWSQGGLGTAVR